MLSRIAAIRRYADVSNHLPLSVIECDASFQFAARAVQSHLPHTIALLSMEAHDVVHILLPPSMAFCGVSSCDICNIHGFVKYVHHKYFIITDQTTHTSFLNFRWDVD